MDGEVSKLSRRDIYLLKGLAILAVGYAHCYNRETTTFWDGLLTCIVRSFSTTGVPIFFVVSGYLFHRKGLLLFLKGKVNTVVAWLFTGTMIWIYEVIRKGIDYANIIDWLTGGSSYLWYMGCVSVIWIVMLFTPTAIIPWLTVMAVIVRFAVFDVGIINLPDVGWLLSDIVLMYPFFGLGYCLQLDNNFVSKVMNCLKRKFQDDHLLFRIIKCLIWLLMLSTISINVFRRNVFEYYSKGFLLYALFMMTFEWGILNSIRTTALQNWISDLGKVSYPVYLLHMPLAGAVCNVFSRWYVTRLFQLFYPLIVVVLMKGVIELIQKRVRYRWIKVLLGIPKNE